MVDLISSTTSLLTTFLLVVGFAIIGAVVLFELGAVFLFWIKDAYTRNPSKTFGRHRKYPDDVDVIV